MLTRVVQHAEAQAQLRQGGAATTAASGAAGGLGSGMGGWAASVGGGSSANLQAAGAGAGGSTGRMSGSGSTVSLPNLEVLLHCSVVVLYERWCGGPMSAHMSQKSDANARHLMAALSRRRPNTRRPAAWSRAPRGGPRRRQRPPPPPPPPRPGQPLRQQHPPPPAPSTPATPSYLTAPPPLPPTVAAVAAVGRQSAQSVSRAAAPAGQHGPRPGPLGTAAPTAAAPVRQG